jgi:hypothetical protein
VFLRFGETPIYKAAYYDHPSTLELLIAKNADVHVVRDKCVLFMTTMHVQLDVRL